MNVLSFERMVYRIANEMARKHPMIDRDDLIQQGFLGLCTTISREPHTSSSKIYIFIRGYMSHYIRRELRRTSNEVNDEYLDVIHEDNHDSIHLDLLMNKLTERERTLLRYKFWEEKPIPEIGRLEACHPHHVCKKINRIINKMKD